MKSGIHKYAVVAQRRGKHVQYDGIKLPSDKEMGESDAERYKYLGILDLDRVLCNEMKEKVKET